MDNPNELHKGITLQRIIEAGHLPAPGLSEPGTKLFIAKTGNDWMNEASNMPPSAMLFSELWYQDELAILFADSNLGKSILAVQIADSIASGVAVEGFQLEAEAQNVVYFDFELTLRQFHKRNSNQADMRRFSPGFIRATFDDAFEIPEGATFEAMVISQIADLMTQYNAKVLVVDNITYLKSDWEKLTVAGNLMKELKAIKTLYGYSILVLAHTPKRDVTKPLMLTDIKGSSSISDFCDAAFALGRSRQNKNTRYIKQVKQRSCEETYGPENVLVGTIEKIDNYVRFKLQGTGDEIDHLPQLVAVDEKEVMKDDILELHGQGLSLREIGKILDIHHSRVDRTVKKHKNEI